MISAIHTTNRKSFKKVTYPFNIISNPYLNESKNHFLKKKKNGAWNAFSCPIDHRKLESSAETEKGRKEPRNEQIQPPFLIHYWNELISQLRNKCLMIMIQKRQSLQWIKWWAFEVKKCSDRVMEVKLPTLLGN